MMKHHQPNVVNQVPLQLHQRLNMDKIAIHEMTMMMKIHQSLLWHLELFLVWRKLVMMTLRHQLMVVEEEGSMWVSHQQPWFPPDGTALPQPNHPSMIVGWSAQLQPHQSINQLGCGQ
jgi:hypothetical protein